MFQGALELGSFEHPEGTLGVHETLAERCLLSSEEGYLCLG